MTYPRLRISPPRVAGRRLLLLAIFVAAGLLTGPGAVAAPENATRLLDFQPSGRYVLFVNRRPAPQARIYHSKSTGAYLVEDAAFPNGVLVYPRTGCVEAVSPNERVARSDGGVDLHVAAMPCRYGRFRLEGADILFRVEQVPARLKPKPPLIGSHWATAVVSHTPEYARDAKRYHPDPATVQRLARSSAKVRVVVFFGSWCSTCTRLIPRILRVEEEVKKLGGNITFDYFGLPSPPAFHSAPEVRRMRIVKLPAGFLYEGDRMIGRLESTSWNQPEVALARYVR